jgi:hypothetical protein
MFKYLRIAMSALSLAVCVLLVALWARSYYACDRMSGRVAGRASIILVSYTGRLSAVAIEGKHLKWNFPRWDSGPILPTTTFPPSDRQIDWVTTNVVWPTRTTKGFGWIYRSMYLNRPNGEIGWDSRGLSGRSQGAISSGGIMPHWFAFMSFAFLAAVPWIRWSKSFSLRTLLIATTLVAVALGVVVAVR